MVTELFEISDKGTVFVRVHVHPGAGRTSVVGRHGDALKVKVAAPPTAGRANEACSELLASIFGVKAADVTLSAGASSRSKRFEITGIETDDVPKLLERALDGVETERKRGAR